MTVTINVATTAQPSGSVYTGNAAPHVSLWIDDTTLLQMSATPEAIEMLHRLADATRLLALDAGKALRAVDA